MIKYFFDSFTDNIKEKTRNPFLGTYAIVWLIRNWYVVYIVFNFDKECTIDDKLRLITEYFERNPFWINVGININYTFGILIGTYVLLNLSRVIVNSFERNVTPWIYKITDMSSIVKKEEYDVAVKRINELNAVIEEERNKRYKLQETYDNLEQELASARTKLLEKEMLKTESQSGEHIDKNSSSHIEKIFKKFTDSEVINSFVDISSNIRKGVFLNDERKDLDLFTTYGLIERDGFSRDSSGKKYKLTALGEDLMIYINSID